jgi:hypothetical protein
MIYSLIESLSKMRILDNPSKWLLAIFSIAMGNSFIKYIKT